MFSSLEVRNVQEAYVRGLALVRKEGVLEETRDGSALVVPWPVATVYERPYERVLLDPVRDANPFFHLMESFWMLAGRRDVESIDPFLGSLKKYSDDGKVYHGAYGHRWRYWFGHDQLEHIIDLLRANPSDRRIVLQMWDAESDLGREGKDFPCNTQCMFRVRRAHNTWSGGVNELDMTVHNRSNDAIWGAYGANAVHFSVLQEFVAAAIGASPGRMYQWSNNLHAYSESLEKVGEPRLYTTRDMGYVDADSPPSVGLTMYQARDFRASPLFHPHNGRRMPAEEILRQIDVFWDGSDSVGSPEDMRDFFTPTGLFTAIMVRSSYLAYKNKEYDRAASLANDIPAIDWRRACVEWLDRRRASRSSKV